LGTGALNGAGVATFTTSTLTIGNNDITAIYAGDANFNGSSDALNHIVMKIPTMTAVVSSVNPSVHGQSVTFTATVTGGTPTGNVNFYNNGVLIGTSALNAAGIATFTTSTLSVGTHPITAEYEGDATHEESDDPIGVDQVVDKADTETTVVSDLNPSVYGQSVTFTATVTAVSPGAGIPTGDVEFYDGVMLIGTSTLNAAGVATFTTSTLAVGNHPITATYLGDGDFKTSTDPIGELQVVLKADTITTVASGLNPSVFGDNVTFTATVAAVSPGAGMPTGNLTFYIDGVPVGTFPLDAAGKATFTTNVLAVGDHVIAAHYEGDANFNDSMSANIIQSVTSPGTARLYYIKASSDGSSMIYHSGTVAVPKGANEKFVFSAKTGYKISAVLIDGVPLTRAEIDKGSYTFFDVIANHTIVVTSTVKGSGDDEIDDGAKGGGDADDKGGDADDKTGLNGIKWPWWVLLVIGILFLAGIFWWFLFYYRRKYDVIKVESEAITIIGDDKVRRKTAYHFTVEGKVSGDIYYRIGYDDDAVWKIITPDQNNEYTIPRKEVVNDITIELR